MTDVAFMALFIISVLCAYEMRDDRNLARVKEAYSSWRNLKQPRYHQPGNICNF